MIYRSDVEFCLVEAGRQLGAQCPRRGQVGHGRWYIDAHVPGPDGRQKRLRQGGFLSRAAAEEGLAAVLELSGPEAMAEMWTVKRWLEYWLSQVEDRLWPSTLRAYRSVTRGHLIPWLGRYRLVDLNGRRGVKTVQRAVDAISRQEVTDGELIAPGTVHRIVAVLRSAFSEARRQGLVSSKWDVEHVSAFLDAVEDDPLFPLSWLVAPRGLRRGEVWRYAALTWTFSSAS